MKMKCFIIFFAKYNFIVVVKLRRMSWRGYVAPMAEKRKAYGVVWINLKERDRYEDFG
jgi:hypothetical protein